MKQSFLFWLFIGLSSLLQAQTVEALADKLVLQHRHLIVLSQDGTQVLEARAVSEIGLHLLHESRHLQTQLLENIRGDARQLETFLRVLEDTTQLWDVDKLSLLELVYELETEIWPEDLSQRLREDREVLEAIQNLYNEELSGMLGAFQGRAMPLRRKRWEAYLDMLRQRFPIAQLKALYAHHHPEPDETTRGKNSIWGYGLPEKTVVLTFDDGPHGKYTDQVMEILNARDLPAIFFQVGNNVGRKQANSWTPSSNSGISKQVFRNDRFWLGNHSTSHQLLSKLDSTEMVAQIEDCFAALTAITGDSSRLFRPPYGGLNAATRNYLKSQGVKPYMWNIDSRDWADPVPASIAHRVVTETEKQGKGVILLHDIRRKTVEALPLILDTLSERGYRFALWDGERLSKPKAAPIPKMKPYAASKVRSLYPNAWALVIGVNAYQQWPQLQYAVNDAQGVKQVLTEKLGFREDHILSLTDEEATRENILKTIGERLADPSVIGPEDAVFIFFAGHGMTRSMPSGKSLGYIIPVDAGTGAFVPQAISMTELQDLNELIPARHVLWIMDACYSGLALTRSGNQPPSSQRYLQEVTSRRGRQVLTAGGSDEEVADGGPNGHSIFTWNLLNGLSGDADLNGDGFITASEVFNYVPPLVSSMSRQTPAFGSMVGSSGGDFVFALQADEEELSANSEQLDDENLALRQEIASLREQLARMEQRLAQNANEARGQERGEAAPLSVADQVVLLNNEGLALYRQKNYSEALIKFQEAAWLDSNHVQSANNVGFLLFRMGRYPEAKTWLQRTLSLDPDRKVAFLNYADVLAELGEKKKAIGYYQKYLDLQEKPSDFTRKIEARIAALKKER
ncbi:MAG: polysaccharide deacetylase family protein [Salibacteraceae bacterium]